MIHFKIVPHLMRKCDVVEVWDDRIFIATIAPHDPGELRIISKYLPEIRQDANGCIVSVDFSGGSFVLPRPQS
jgi:hypothetical protein